MIKDLPKRQESDLACERARADVHLSGVEFERRTEGAFTTERVRIKSKAGMDALGRPIGSYFTLHTGRLDLLDESNLRRASIVIAREIKSLADSFGAKKILAVGLGSAKLTPDSVGPKGAERINAIAKAPNKEASREVAVIAPGTAGKAGLCARDIIIGVSKVAKSELCLAIDSLACTSKARLGSCIQISDTGIFPGSGVGGGSIPINRETVGIPVIAIGAPTVLRAAVLDEEGESLEEMLVCDRHIDALTDSAAELIAQGINLALE